MRTAIIALLIATTGLVAADRKERPKMKKLTPILLVDKVEPCLPFWIDGLGFTKTAEVPGDAGLVFAMLQKDGIEIMYQTRKSVIDDLPAGHPLKLDGTTVLYIEVDSLDPIRELAKKHKVYSQEREMFYGATEIGILEPGGHAITFAEMKKQDAD